MKKNKKSFSDLVNEKLKTLFIYNYYPYGKEYKFPAMGRITNLKTIDWYDKYETEDEIIIQILAEVGRALSYCDRQSDDIKDWFFEQKITANCLWILFTNGYHYYDKKIIKDKSPGEIETLWFHGLKKYSTIYPHTYSLVDTPFSLPQVKKYGVIQIPYLPLCRLNFNNAKYKKHFFTIKQLRAILFMVNMTFENMC